MVECANEEPDFLKKKKKLHRIVTDLQVLPRNKGTVVTTEDTGVSKTKGVTGVVEDHVDFFFFLLLGVVHHMYAPDGQTINKEHNLQVVHHI